MKTAYSTLLGITALTASLSVAAADYSAGLTLGTTGLGLNFSQKSNLQFRENDQIQTRLQIAGISVDDIDEIEINDTDYEGDLETISGLATLDWYPFDNRFFVSAGLNYGDYDLSMNSEKDQAFDIGSHRVGRNDNVTANLDVDHNGLAPYLGIGWGNRIGVDNGFSFLAEVGMLIPGTDPDVKYTVTDPDNQVPVEDIAAEKKKIEDELDGIAAVASIGVTYHF